jgi:Rrf2 family protein
MEKMIMRLSSAAGYALSAVTYMATNKEDVPVASHVVAAARGIPERFLLKVLKPLVAARILSSIKGPNGGYRLTRTPQSVTLLEIVEAVDGPIQGVAPRLSARRSESPVRRVMASAARKSGATLDRNLQGVCKDAAQVVRANLSKVRVSTLLGK